MRYKTINEATQAWVREMNAYPQEMIKQLMEYHPDDWTEVTKPSEHDMVYVYDECSDGEIINVNDGAYTIRLNNGTEIECESSDFELDKYTYLPMWGTMWSFGSSCDDWWLEEGNGIELMSQCGFRIYASEEFGYFFGIDGAGYDFYESHWIPLYKARGLHWHETETEE